jgi:hypothetical protein
MPYESSSAASDVSLARFYVRIVRAMLPSAARGKTAECVAVQSPAVGGRGDRDVAIAVAGPGAAGESKRSSARSPAMTTFGAMQIAGRGAPGDRPALADHRLFS